MRIKKILGIAALVQGVAMAAPINYTTGFSLRDYNKDGIAEYMDDTPPDGFWGYVTEVWTDEFFVEFNLVGLTSVESAAFQFEMENRSWSSAYGSSKIFSVASYVGDGVASASDFGVENALTTLAIPNVGALSYSLDVTDLINSNLTAGNSYLGIRFYDPIWTSNPSLGSQVFFNSGYLDVTESAPAVPEPTSLALISLGLAIVVYRRRKIQIRQNEKESTR